MGSSVVMMTLTAVIKLLIMGLVGFVAAKAGVLNEQRTSALSALLGSIILPMMIFGNCLKSFDPTRTSGYVFVLLGSLFLSILMILLSSLVFPKSRPEWANERNSAALSNAGFVGIPLLTLMGNSDGLFYMGASVLVINAILWTYTLLCYSGDKLSGKTFVKLLKTPSIVAIILGVIFYFCRIPMPEIIASPIQTMGAATGPVAMFITGAILSRTDIMSVLKKGSSYAVMVIKFIAQPLLAILLCKLFDVPEAAKITLIIGAACPIMTFCPIFAMQYGKDEKYAAGLLSISMILCIIAVPAAVALYTIL